MLKGPIPRALPLLLALGALLEGAFACSSTGHSEGTTDAGDGGESDGGESNGGGSKSNGGTGGAAIPGGMGALGGDSSEGGDSGAGGSTDLPPLACTPAQAMTGTEIAASNADESDDFAPTCGKGTGLDAEYEWVVPRTDYYRLSTEGSSFDTVLAVYADDCSTELVCNNNDGGTPQSAIVRQFQRGEQVAVVVDGYLGDDGDYLLHIDPVTCPETDLTRQPLPAELSTVNAANVHAGACGGAGVRERSVRWTPPQPGLYRFSVASDEFSPALYLEQGAECGSSLLSCNATSVRSYPAEVTRWLPAAEPVTLIVDSKAGEGAFTLDARRLNASCPSSTALPSQPRTLDSTTASHLLSGSCSPAGVTGFGGPEALVDDSYPLDIDLCPTCACRYQIESNLPVAAYLIQGDRCDGPETRCMMTTSSSPGMYTGSFNFNPADNGSYVLVIENPSPNGVAVTYSIVISCIA